MQKLNILRNIFTDIQYRAKQHDFDIQTKFDNERSAIQITRIKDSIVVFRYVVNIKSSSNGQIDRSDQIKSQIEAFKHFISYMSFYGIFTVAHSYDEEQLDKENKKKEEIKRQEIEKQKIEEQKIKELKYPIFYKIIKYFNRYV